MDGEHETELRDTPATHTVGATRRKITAKPEGVLPKILRVGALLLTVGSIAGVIGYRRVHGQISENLISTGAQMMLLAEAERQDAPRELNINGQQIHFTSGIAPMTPDALLRQFETRCQRVDGGMMSRLAETMTENAERPEAARLAALRPIMREIQGDVGYVACLDMGHEERSWDEIIARFRTFQRTRDLHDFGDLRYVFAKPASRPGHTHFVAIWNDGSLRMNELLVESGDARGTDVPNIPRPPGSRRVLTAQEGRGIGEIARVYEGSEYEEGQLDGFYRRELPAYGWEILDGDPRGAATAAGRPALVARRGSELAFISLTTDRHGRGGAAIITAASDEPADDS